MKKLLMIALLVCLIAVGYVFGETQDLTVGGTVGYPYSRAGMCFTLIASNDFATTTGAVNDVIQMINIPADTYVQNVQAEVVAMGATLTFDVGDGTTTNQYHTQLDGNVTTNTMPATTVAKYYTSADTIDVIPANNWTGGVLVLRAIVWDCNE